MVNKSLHHFEDLQSNNIHLSINNASDFEPAAEENITNTSLTNSPSGNSNFQVEESNVSINTNSSINKLSIDKKSLNFASLNVCGLRRKVLYPEFSDLVKSYDLFCVCETKIDKYDDINLPGYVFLSQCRKQKYIRKSGEIGVFVKHFVTFTLCFIC